MHFGQRSNSEFADQEGNFLPDSFGWSLAPAQKGKGSWMNQRGGCKPGGGITFPHQTEHLFICSTVPGHLFTRERASLPWSGYGLPSPADGRFWEEDL